MRIAVTGANGLVGSRLCHALVAQGHEVVALARGPLRAPVRVARYLSVDLTDADAVTRALDDTAPTSVVHTASMTEVDQCERAPAQAYAANVTTAAHVAQAARALGAHLVHVSTDYVFDGANGPYDETAVPHPLGVYALTKHMGEQAVQVLAGSWSLARTAVVYGWPPSARPNFGSWLVETLSRGGEVKLFEDQWVSPSFAGNVADMLAELAIRKLSGVWNVAGAETVDRVTFGRALCRQFGLDDKLILPTKMKDVGLQSPRPPRSGLRTDKAAQKLTHPPLSLQASLERFYAEVQASR